MLHYTSRLSFAIFDRLPLPNCIYFSVRLFAFKRRILKVNWFFSWNSVFNVINNYFRKKRWIAQIYLQASSLKMLTLTKSNSATKLGHQRKREPSAALGSLVLGGWQVCDCAFIIFLSRKFVELLSSSA